MNKKGNNLKATKPKEKNKPIRQNKYALPALIVILILTCILFYPILNYGFINFDDPHYIIENDLIKDLSWNGIKTIISNFESDNYAPVTDLISAVQYRIGGLSPAVFHLGSLVFHLLNVGMVFWFVLLLTSGQGILKKNENQYTGNWIIASITALFFAIHPLQVESVAWASTRSNLFYTFFFLGSLITYLFYLRNQEKKYFFFSILLFVLSILSKSVGIGLPLILLLIDFYEKRKIGKKAIIEKIPFFIIAILIGIINLTLKQNAGAVNEVSFTLFERFLFGMHNIIGYIEKIFIPHHLSAYYPYPVIQSVKNLNIIYFIAPLLVIGIFLALFRSMKFTKVVLFGVAFYFITIFPLLQFISQGNAIMAERYVYLPCVGLFFIIGTGARYILVRQKKYNIYLSAILIIVTLILSVITYKRTELWKDSVLLWTDVIEKNPNDSYGYSNRCNAKTKAKDYEGALADCNMAVKLAPNDSEAYFFRANVKSLSKNYAEAMHDYDVAVRLNYAVIDKGYYYRGLMKSHLDDFAGAIMDYDSAIAINPGIPDFFMNRAAAKYNQKDYAGAIKDNSEAIRLNTVYMGEAYFWRGAAESKLDQMEIACKDFKKAAELGVELEREMVSQLCK